MSDIFIIDDDDSLSAIVRLILQKKGFQAREIGDAKTALEVLGVEPEHDGAVLPGAILMDVGLPDMSGFTLASMLHEHPRTKAIPVIFLTGRGQFLEVTDLTQNVKAYVEKPFEFEPLLKLIRDALDGKLLRDAPPK